MKIRKAIMGSTVLFASSCWGPATVKPGPDTGLDASADGTVTQDTVVAGKDEGQPGDASTCYERPQDPLALIGESCAWETHVECDDLGSIVAVCKGSQWVANETSFQPSGTDCACVPSKDCEPPVMNCQPTGVGFLGIAVAGWDRRADRSLRLI